MAEWFGLDAGTLREGDRADFVVIDPAGLDDAVDGYHFVSVGARYGSVERNASASFDTRVHAISIGGRWRSFYASFTTNRWRPQDATALGLSLGASLRW